MMIDPSIFPPVCLFRPVCLFFQRKVLTCTFIPTYTTIPHLRISENRHFSKNKGFLKLIFRLCFLLQFSVEFGARNSQTKIKLLRDCSCSCNCCSDKKTLAKLITICSIKHLFSICKQIPVSLIPYIFILSLGSTRFAGTSQVC